MNIKLTKAGNARNLFTCHQLLVYATFGSVGLPSTLKKPQIEWCHINYVGKRMITNRGINKTPRGTQLKISQAKHEGEGEKTYTEIESEGSSFNIWS